MPARRTWPARLSARRRCASVVNRWVVSMLAVASILVAACSKPASLTAVERGRRVYLANCVTCHNPDPAKPGSAGPEIADASHELLEARVVHGTYPPGYTPKRPTRAMVALPQLSEKIGDLAAFLAAPGS